MEQIGKSVVEEKLQQVIGEFPFPAIFAYVPWGHHIDIITKCDSIEEALFYIYRVYDGLKSLTARLNRTTLTLV